MSIFSCGQRSVSKTEPQKPNAQIPHALEFVLQSPAFEDFGRIPDRYTGKGEDVSPPLTWHNFPAGTRSFALIVDDPDAPGGTFTHWLIYNLAPVYRGLPGLAEAVPKSESLTGELVHHNGGRQLKNDFGKVGYSGPMPPPGKLHHYVFQLYALDQMLSTSITGKKQLRDALPGHILDQTKLTGTFQR
jgi:hypothetical protein